jgi:hypothetical protein
MNSASTIRNVDNLLTLLIECNRQHFDGRSKVAVAREVAAKIGEKWQSLRPQFLTLRYSRTWPASFPDESTIDELIESSLSWKWPNPESQEHEFADWWTRIGRVQSELLQWSGMISALSEQEMAYGNNAKTVKSKRSTERGEGRVKLIAALTKHHQYRNGSCLNWDPIGNNELARQAEVANSTALKFFDDEFNEGEKGGHAKYRAGCAIDGRLINALKILNREFTPHILYGAAPRSEKYDDE